EPLDLGGQLQELPLQLRGPLPGLGRDRGRRIAHEFGVREFPFGCGEFLARTLLQLRQSRRLRGNIFLQAPQRDVDFNVSDPRARRDIDIATRVERPQFRIRQPIEVTAVRLNYGQLLARRLLDEYGVE